MNVATLPGRNVDSQRKRGAKPQRKCFFLSSYRWKRGTFVKGPPPAQKTRTPPPRNVIIFVSPMKNQRLQRWLLGTRWSQMLVFNSSAGVGVVKKIPNVRS